MHYKQKPAPSGTGSHRLFLLYILYIEHHRGNNDSRIPFWHLALCVV